MTRRQTDPSPGSNDLDREFRAQLAKMTAGISPTAFANA